MKGMLHAPSVFIEIGQSTLTVLDGDDGLELSLERGENGRLTPSCAERLQESLRVFLKKHSWRSPVRAYCALNARGVSLRRMTLPACGKEELDRLVALQIERELPLPPAELAWGYRGVKGASDDPTKQEVLVAAIKRDVLDDYSALLANCGVDAVFTLGALARGELCGQSASTYSLLDIGRHQSEIISFQQGAPTGVRVLAWGGENVTRAIEQASGLDRAEAEKLKLHLDENAAANGEISSAIHPAIEREVSALAQSVAASAVGDKLYVTGATSRLRNLPSQLAQGLGSRIRCERLDLEPNEGRSAAVLGLRKAIERNGAAPPLLFQLGSAAANRKAAAYTPWKWAALAVGLALVVIALRYADVVVRQPRLERQLASMKAYRENLPIIERELAFLQYLKTNQPAYVDVISVIANATGGGTKLDSLSIGRSGDVSLRATMRDAQQVTDFRSRLIDSGFFSTVVVEEQSPSAQDKQKLSVRVAGKWKLDSELPATPPADKPKAAPAPAKAARGKG